MSGGTMSTSSEVLPESSSPSVQTQCPLENCQHSFSSAAALILHLRQMHTIPAGVASSPLKRVDLHCCPICFQSFHSQYLLSVHSLAIHSHVIREQDAPTTDEHSDFRKNPVKRQSEDAEDSISSKRHCGEMAASLSCGLCNKKVTNHSELALHILHQHSRLQPHIPTVFAPEELCQCDKCDFTTHNEEEMCRHLTIHNCAEWVKNVSHEEGKPPTQSSTVMPWSFPGAKKSRTLDSDGAFRMKRFDIPFCESTQRSPSPDTINDCVPVSNGATFQTEPRTIEEGEDSSFDVIRAMKARGEFPCRLCDQVFPNLRAMKGHNRVHMGSSPYDCNVCTFCSTDKTTLVRHMKDHNGERPYECRLCHFAFTTKANCERHLKNRHHMRMRDELLENLIVNYTPDCGAANSPQKTQPMPSSLLTTTAAVCPICDMNVKLPKQLAEHMRLYHPLPTTKSKTRITCSVCDISFPDHRIALQHARVYHAHKDPIHVIHSVRSGGPSTALNTVRDISEREPNLSSPTAVRLIRPRTPDPPKLSTAGAISPAFIPSSPKTRCDKNPSMDEYMPLDLSKKTPNEFSNSVKLEPNDSMKSYVSSSLINTTPFSEFFPFPSPMPFQLLPNLLGSSVEQPWKQSLSHEVSKNIYLRQNTEDLLIQHQKIMALSSIFSMASQARNAGQQNDNLSAEQLEDSVWATKNNYVRIHPKEHAVLESEFTDPSLPRKPKQRRYRTQRPFFCNYCEARFTLSTNMDRHVKNHHPDKWERKSRGGRRLASVTSSPTLLAVKSEPEYSLPELITSGGGDSGIHESIMSSRNNDSGTQEPCTPPQNHDGEDDKNYNGADNSKLLDYTSTSSVRRHNDEHILRMDTPDDEDAISRCTFSLSSSDEGEEGRQSSNCNAPNKVICSVCQRQFPWSSSPRRHQLTHSEKKHHRCQRCRTHFTTKSNRQRHLLRKHSNSSPSEEEYDGQADENLFDVTDLKDRSDDLCDPHSPEDLLEHCGEDRSLFNDSPNRRNQQSQCVEESIGELSRRFWCHLCCSEFPDLQQVQLHLKQHHPSVWTPMPLQTHPEATGNHPHLSSNQETVTCIFCTQQFETTVELRTHICTEHVQERRRPATPRVIEDR